MCLVVRMGSKCLYRSFVWDHALVAWHGMAWHVLGYVHLLQQVQAGHCLKNLFLLGFSSKTCHEVGVRVLGVAAATGGHWQCRLWLMHHMSSTCVVHSSQVSCLHITTW